MKNARKAIRYAATAMIVTAVWGFGTVLIFMGSIDFDMNAPGFFVVCSVLLLSFVALIVVRD